MTPPVVNLGPCRVLENHRKATGGAKPEDGEPKAPLSWAEPEPKLSPCMHAAENSSRAVHLCAHVGPDAHLLFSLTGASLSAANLICCPTGASPGQGSPLSVCCSWEQGCCSPAPPRGHLGEPLTPSTILLQIPSVPRHPLMTHTATALPTYPTVVTQHLVTSSASFHCSATLCPSLHHEPILETLGSLQVPALLVPCQPTLASPKPGFQEGHLFPHGPRDTS